MPSQSLNLIMASWSLQFATDFGERNRGLTYHDGPMIYLEMSSVFLNLRSHGQATWYERLKFMVSFLFERMEVVCKSLLADKVS